MHSVLFPSMGTGQLGRVSVGFVVISARLHVNYAGVQVMLVHFRQGLVIYRFLRMDFRSFLVEFSWCW